jgi:hypothetical protein
MMKKTTTKEAPERMTRLMEKMTMISFSSLNHRGIAIDV